VVTKQSSGGLFPEAFQFIVQHIGVFARRARQMVRPSGGFSPQRSERARAPSALDAAGELVNVVIFKVGKGEPCAGISGRYPSAHPRNARHLQPNSTVLADRQPGKQTQFLEEQILSVPDLERDCRPR